MKTKYNNMIIRTFLTMLIIQSCEDFVQIDPPRNELSTSTVFKNDATAEAALRGVYAKMTNPAYSFSSGFSTSVGALTALYVDEVVYLNQVPTRLEFLNNALTPPNTEVLNNWNSIYSIIYDVNSILTGIEISNISEAVREQIEGESKFIRAFCYFYLVNLWGDVPLVLTTDYRVNATLSRAYASDVFDQILSDLISSRELLREDYSASNGERTRANKMVVTAFLARVYLYLEDWTNAEIEATAIIDNSATYSLLSDLNAVFLKNSAEAIWQLFPANTTLDTYEGQMYIPDLFLIEEEGLLPSYTLSDQLTSSFESMDNRKIAWLRSIDVDGTIYTYPFKYKVRSHSASVALKEYSMVLRLAEQYLIRAEARAQLDNVSGMNSAESDINTIRSRAGLTNTNASTKEQMLLAIENERRAEFFTEWGHRWFDLKRTNRANTVLSGIKSNWGLQDLLWPIPQTERTLNSNLSQNDGY